MKKNPNLTRKQLEFHLTKPEEKNACEILDKARYYQTAFIAKLVNEFFVKQGLTTDTPYEIVQSVIRSYIAGTLPEDNQGKALSATDNAILMMMQMQSAMMQQLNAQQINMMNAQYHPVQAGPVGVSPETNEATPQTMQGIPTQNFATNVPTNNTLEEEPLPISEKKPKKKPVEQPVVSNDDIDDEDEMDEDLSKFAAGFSNMLS